MFKRISLAIVITIFTQSALLSHTNAQQSDMEKAAVEALKALDAIVFVDENNQVEVDLSCSNHIAEAKSHLARLPHLTVLRLDESNVTDADLESLSGLRELEEIYLYETEVTENGVAHLASITNLESLDVSGTKVTDGIASVLIQFHNLKVLDLSSSNVGDLTMRYLGVYASSVPVETLHVPNTNITDAGLAWIEKSASLKLINIAENNELSVEAIDSFKQFRPSCNVAR